MTDLPHPDPSGGRRAALTCAAALLALAWPTIGPCAPLAPSSGPVSVTGTLGQGGRFEIQAVLAGGSFTGTAKLTLAGQSVEGTLLPKRSYYENGKCYFRFEAGRSRGDIHGRCDSTSLDGNFDTLIAGQGTTGKASGTVTLGQGAAAAPAGGQLPVAKLTCAYQDRKFTSKVGGATEYSLAFSNMRTLQLAGGSYRTANGSGSYQRTAPDKIRLLSGPFQDAVGTLEPDRSGRPAVVFQIEENRRPGGVHIVDPYTTRCTEARS